MTSPSARRSPASSPARRAAYLLSYPFLAALGLAIGYSVLWGERWIKEKRRRREEEEAAQKSYWLAGVADD